MEPTTQNEERSYIAFISYRHTPLDREAATRVQKKIENYVVPKEFREQVGGKKLGLCFRDEDELPATSSLTDSIYYALDHTKFLIVVCTPDLPLSKWCEAEIKYFLKTHDRDHILAVLADGDPSESFSPYMLHTFDDEGNITGDTEPLAANIAGPNHTIDNKAFKKEIVRVYAALIGCPFDSLWQRERRARTNRLLSLAGAAVAVLAVFLGVVLNRNARIEEQNVQILAQNDQITQQNAKIEEQNTNLQTQLSQVLVDSGLNKYKERDIKGALSDGLQALESDDPSVYDHRAVKLLADSLGAYTKGDIQSLLVYEQAQIITDMNLTDDEKYALIKDFAGTITCLDTEDYEVRWQISTGDEYTTLYTHNLENRFLYKTQNGLYCCSLEDGSLLWSYEHPKHGENYFQAISEDSSLFAVADYIGEDSYIRDNPVFVVFLDTKDGSLKGQVEMVRESVSLELSPILSEPLEYAASFSDDNKMFACIIPAELENENGEKEDGEAVFTIDIQTSEKYNVGIMHTVPAMFYGIDVLSEDQSVFLAGYSVNFGGVYSVLCTKNGEDYEFNSQVADHDLRTPQGIGVDDESYESNDCHFLSNGTRVLIFSDDDMLIYDRAKNRLMRTYAMNDTITNAYWNDSSKMNYEVTMSDGSVLGYDFGEDNLYEMIYALEDFDLTDLVSFQPVNKGMIRNAEAGSYLCAGGEEGNCVFLSRYITDPHFSTLVADPDADYKYTSEVLFAPGSDVVQFLYNGNSAAFFDRKTGELIQKTDYGDSFSLYDPVVLDDEHFLVQDKQYGMDGSVEPFGEPFYINSDPQYPSSHVRCSDGTFLSLKPFAANYLVSQYSDLDDFQAAFEPYPSMALVWKDGKPLPLTNDPSKTLMLQDEYMQNESSQTAGANGLIVGYGRRVTLENEKLITEETARFHVFDPDTGTIVSMDNKYPDSGEFSCMPGNKSSRFAISYSDGAFCVYSPDTQTVVDLDFSYKSGEITAFSFSDKDDYLLLLTKNGRLDIYDTRDWSMVFSRTIDMYHKYSMKYDWTFRTLEVLHSADRQHLLVMADFLSSNYCVVLDPSFWTLEAEAEEVLSYDPAANQLFFRGSGLEVLACPLYDLTDLKAWASEELEK